MRLFTGDFTKQVLLFAFRLSSKINSRVLTKLVKNIVGPGTTVIISNPDRRFRSGAH